MAEVTGWIWRWAVVATGAVWAWWDFIERALWALAEPGRRKIRRSLLGAQIIETLDQMKKRQQNWNSTVMPHPGSAAFYQYARQLEGYRDRMQADEKGVVELMAELTWLTEAPDVQFWPVVLGVPGARTEWTEKEQEIGA